MLHFFRATTTATIAVIFSMIATANIATSAAAFSFEGETSGSFGLPEIDPNQDPNPTFSVESLAPGNTRFTLGQPGEDSRPNHLAFTAASFTATENEPFSVGEIAFFNGQTFDGTNVSGVPLNIELSLDSVSQSPYQFQYQFEFDLTLNNTDNYDDDADFVAIEDETQTYSFDFEQTSYELAFLGFSQNNGETYNQPLRALEDQTVSSTLFAQIKLAAIDAANNPATDIPEPALITACLALGSTLLLKRRAI